ncbi:MAG: hypothetical protein L0Y72_19605 [Gemmataceae bacterium]|nr:hypothetical protein [Gemmataceae bacterium]MCI0741243.1 hypothetical protein [Gemmataceae bacterium]
MSIPVSDSPNAINLIVEGVWDNTRRPIDPSSAYYARVMEFKKLLEEQKKKDLKEQEEKQQEGKRNDTKPEFPPSS